MNTAKWTKNWNIFIEANSIDWCGMAWEDNLSTHRQLVSENGKNEICSDWVFWYSPKY